MSMTGISERNLLSKKEQKNKYRVEGYNIDLGNKNDSHAIIVNAAKGAKKVLDVGCGAGYIGTKLKALGTKNVDGIEIDAEAKKQALKTYDMVEGFSLDASSGSKKYADFVQSNRKYDCIIFADILEHLVDPGKTLADFSRLLSKNGKIIVSIPNIGNIDVIIGLIDQRFNYTKTGTLDSTHLRFWTENSFYDFLENINEMFGLNLQANLIAHTYARNEAIDDGLLARIVGNDVNIFQNIFEIQKIDNPRQPRKRTHNYQKLSSYITNLEKAKAELTMQLQEREKELNDLKNSKSWKITAPLRMIGRKKEKE